MNIPKIAQITLICLIAGLLIFFGVEKYETFRCQSSFGLELNERRIKLKIPILPSNFKVYIKDEHSTMWESPKVKKGHGFKVIVYDDCELDGEEDHFYFSSKNIQDTVLEIDYRYINSHRTKDSTIFTFQIKDHPADTITSKQADSIFKAYKINRDY